MKKKKISLIQSDLKKNYNNLLKEEYLQDLSKKLGVFNIIRKKLKEKYSEGNGLKKKKDFNKNK